MAEKTRYSDEELKEFDTLIELKLVKAREQVGYYLTQIKELAEGGDITLKGSGDGVAQIESERLQTLAARQNKIIKHLENAKLRVQNKVYGICRITGALISKERLKAVPHATLSIKAKQIKPQ